MTISFYRHNVGGWGLDSHFPILHSHCGNHHLKIAYYWLGALYTHNRCHEHKDYENDHYHEETKFQPICHFP